MELLIIKNSPTSQLVPLLSKDEEGKMILNPQAEDEEENLNVLSVTWNMGASESKNLMDGLEGIF